MKNDFIADLQASGRYGYEAAARAFRDPIPEKRKARMVLSFEIPG